MEESNQLLRLHSNGYTIWDLKTKQISSVEHDFPLLEFCRCGSFFAFALSDKILIGKFVKMHFNEVKSIPISDVADMSSNGNQMLIICETNQPTQIWYIYESSTWEIKSQFTTHYPMDEEYLDVILANDSIILNCENTISILNFRGEKISVLLTHFYGLIRGISPDFKFLLIISHHEYQIVEIETRKAEVLKGLKCDKFISEHCWSENGKYLVVANEDAELQIWDLGTITLKKSLNISFETASICASKDFSEIFVGSMNGSIWNFKIAGLDTNNVELELIWVHQPSFIATNANLKGTTIRNENRSILEHYGAMKESSELQQNATTQSQNVENEDFGESSTKIKSSDGKRKLTDDGDKNETDDAKKQRTE